MKTILVLKILGSMAGGLWLGALIGATYFLYDALTRGGSWLPLLLLAAAALAARIIAAAIDRSHRRLDYVSQLRTRGYAAADAAAAWRTFQDGGSNALLNLQQAESLSVTGSTKPREPASHPDSGTNGDERD